jgi:catechol 2,3-dioxygenase-like lactoylglutathione lyase family enzyme
VISAVHHVAVHVPSLADAERFYAGVLGLDVVRRQAHAVWVNAGSTIVMLELCPEAAAPDRVTTPGLFVLAFSIARTERETWLARLGDHRVVVEKQSDFSLFFRDPWGTRLALSHYPEL